MQKGFTIIEVLFAIFILALGVTGVFALVERIIPASATANSHLTAVYLAQEGNDIVRNIRDTNLLHLHKGIGADWKENLTSCALGCEIDHTYDAESPAFVDFQGDFETNGRFLLLNSDFYDYVSGTASIYKRKIIITDVDADTLEVETTVWWKDQGKSKQVQATSEMYNWLQEI